MALAAACGGGDVSTVIPTEAPAHFEAGVALQQKGHLEEAIAEYDEAIRLDPDAEKHNN